VAHCPFSCAIQVDSWYNLSSASGFESCSTTFFKNVYLGFILQELKNLIWSPEFAMINWIFICKLSAWSALLNLPVVSYLTLHLEIACISFSLIFIAEFHGFITQSYMTSVLDLERYHLLLAAKVGQMPIC
jgi:hypothetical protein